MINSKNKQGASRAAKAHGLTSLIQIQEHCGYSADSLQRFFRDNPARFDALCVGTAVALGIYQPHVTINDKKWVRE